MTAQTGEILFFKGEETWMATEPLNQYLQNRNDIKFVPSSTACWRGYYGQWEIKDNKLYLIDLEAYIEGYKMVDLNYLFPKGEMLYYVHMGYASLYDRDLFLVFENGVLVKQYEVNNADEYQKRLKQKKGTPCKIKLETYPRTQINIYTLVF